MELSRNASSTAETELKLMIDTIKKNKIKPVINKKIITTTR
ncbi:MAG: hypothetical protein QM532_00285 [Cyanobium sp. MAG06]|nr:hypothetical protein [Cyanobium sp. MAG06]